MVVPEWKHDLHLMNLPLFFGYSMSVKGNEVIAVFPTVSCYNASALAVAKIKIGSKG